MRLGSNPDLWNPEAGPYGLGYDGTVAHNRLLATLCQAMGVPVDHFNNPSYGGPLSELLA